MLASHCLVYFFGINGLRTVGSHRSPSLCISPSSLGEQQRWGLLYLSPCFAVVIQTDLAYPKYHFVCVGPHVPQIRNNSSEAVNHEKTGVIQGPVWSNVKVRKLLQGTTLRSQVSVAARRQVSLCTHTGQPEIKDNHIIFVWQEQNKTQQKSNCQKEILAWGPVCFPSIALHKFSTEGNYLSLQKLCVPLCTQGYHMLS